MDESGDYDLSLLCCASEPFVDRYKTIPGRIGQSHSIRLIHRRQTIAALCKELEQIRDVIDMALNNSHKTTGQARQGR